MSFQNYISRIGASKQRSITLNTSLLKCFSLIYAQDMFYLQRFFSLFICRSLLLFRDVLNQKGLPPSSKAIIHFVSILTHYNISSCFAKCSTGSLSPDINSTPFYHWAFKSFYILFHNFFLFEISFEWLVFFVNSFYALAFQR
ncbi:hypothetical protein NC651_030170 [Populus alba x Populus x berolinensis]|nr:hypothetical protein NC651_030170 [Populus alba x Populus x berolinensis]